MPTVNQSKTVCFSAEQMFALVDNIKDYHLFLPGIVDSFEQNRTISSVEGTLTLQAPGIKKSFTTLNTLDKNKSMRMELIKGPFKTLKGEWTFTSLAKGQTKVSLNLSFEFNSKLLSLAFGPVFHHLCSSLTNAFCERAKTTYGSHSHD